jgi:hypothetical protein
MTNSEYIAYLNYLEEEWHAQDICPASRPVEAQARPCVYPQIAAQDDCEDCAGPDYRAFQRLIHAQPELAPVAVKAF